MFDESKMQALAKRFFDLVEENDWDGFVACYAPDAKIWNNTDEDKQLAPREIAVILQQFDSLLTDKKYEQRQLYVFSGGFVQRHMLCGTRKTDGRRVEMPVCQVNEVTEGKITRTYDFIDSAKLAEFFK